MARLPHKAKVVIVGIGGIVGASVAHHLVERGWDDIVGVDKSGVPTDIGSTAHASDFCYSTSHDFLSCWTTRYSVDFYERLGHYARISGTVAPGAIDSAVVPVFMIVSTCGDTAERPGRSWVVVRPGTV